MNKEKIIDIIVSLIFIILPFLINIYSIYRLIILLIGILILDLVVIKDKKKHWFLVIYFPLLLIIFTYGLDYLKTYLLDLKPIYVMENKINKDVSIYNSVFYRIYKCMDNYIFDNNYEKSFACSPNLLEEILINDFLNEPVESYKKYHNDFVKITGKVSKIVGKRQIELKAYTKTNDNLNGYVDFDDSSAITIKLNDEVGGNNLIYDYITVIGKVSYLNKDKEEIILEDGKIIDNDLYKEYKLEVSLNNKCDNKLHEYSHEYFMGCINDIYLDYGIDKYSLDYALSIGKVSYEDIKNKSRYVNREEGNIYYLDEFKIMECSDKKIILSNKEKEDFNLCKNN